MNVHLIIVAYMLAAHSAMQKLKTISTILVLSKLFLSSAKAYSQFHLSNLFPVAHAGGDAKADEADVAQECTERNYKNVFAGRVCSTPSGAPCTGRTLAIHRPMQSDRELRNDSEQIGLA